MGRLWRGENGRTADSLVSGPAICGECWWRRCQAEVPEGKAGGVKGFGWFLSNL